MTTEATTTRKVISWLLLLGLMATAVSQAVILRHEQHKREHISEHAELILHSVPVAIIICDSSRNITAFNSEAEKLLGWDEDEIIGKPVTTVISNQNCSADRHDEAIGESLRRLLNHPRSRVQETRAVAGDAVDKDGNSIPCRVTVRSVKYDGDVEIIAIVFKQDTLDGPVVEAYETFQARQKK
jgi:PAS domain S-box-containing protein